MGFRPTVHEFETEATAMLGTADPAAPGVLLVDRWALHDSLRREDLRRVDRRNPDWLAALEPWNTADDECADEDGELGRLSEDVLRNAHGGLRPSLRAGNPSAPATLQEFRGAMERAVMRASDGFERRHEPKTNVPEARRPVQQADFESGRRPRLAPLHMPGDDENGGGTARAPPGGGQT
jgi:FxsC-like protein